jgi:hypothetical protein
MIKIMTEKTTKRVNENGEKVPETCPECGSKVELYLRGEPVWCCSNKKCNKCFGALPFNNSKESVGNNNTKAYYDSTKDTEVHRRNVRNVMNMIIMSELEKRRDNHDVSKLQSPEKEVYDKYIPKLKLYQYGTPEYLELREEMAKNGLSHHFKMNRHHPEHFKNGIDDMNIIDLVEMISDWFAASLVSDRDFYDSIDGNAKRFDMPEQLVNILKNTYNDYFKKFEEVSKNKKNVSYIKDLKLDTYERFYNGHISDGVYYNIMDGIENMVKDIEDEK